MKKKWRIILISIISILVVLLAGGFFWLKSNSYTASEAALTATKAVQTSNDDYLFFSSDQKETPAIIFFPGALVATNSYSIWAQKVAEAGYDVYLLKVPLNLAVLAGNRPEAIIEKHTNQKFIIGGHSLGGVMAARFAAANQEQTAGVLFLASYPDEKGSLKEVNLPVLSITGSEDGVLDWKNYEDAKSYLPAGTTFNTIKGGNHAGFGSYGHQKGDSEATISNQQQQEAVAKDVIDWLTEYFPAS